MSKENVSIKGFQEGMTLTEESYILLALSKDGNLDVMFYTPSQFKENAEYEKLSFEEFSEVVFPYNMLDGHTEFNTKEEYESAESSKVVDYENSVVEVSLVEIKKDVKPMLIDGKLDIDGILKRLNRRVDEVKVEALSAHAEGLELAKDPYSYYGLKRSDF